MATGILDKKYFIELKIVSDNLNDCRAVLDYYLQFNGFKSDGIIQEKDGVYWTFINKNNGLLELEPNIKL